MATLLQDIVALVAISNPLGAVPVFLAITERVTTAERVRACAPRSPPHSVLPRRRLQAGQFSQPSEFRCRLFRLQAAWSFC